MATGTFPGSSAYQHELSTGRDVYVIDAVSRVRKNSGSGYWTSSGYAHSQSIGSTNWSGTWEYDFRNTSLITVASRSASKASGRVDIDASVTMGSGIGTRALSETETIPSVPPAPDITGFSGVTSSSFNMSFSSNGTGGSSVTKWQWQYSTSSTFGSGNSSVMDSGDGSVSASGLNRADRYYVRARGVNAMGTGGWSTTKYVDTLAQDPSAPRSPSVAPVNTTTGLLKWTAPSDNGGKTLGNYEITVSTTSNFSSGNKTFTSGGTTTQRDLTGLEPATLYYTRIRATNPDGESAYVSGGSFTTDAEPPGVPTGVTAASVPPDRINVSWSLPSDTGGKANAGSVVQFSEASNFSSPIEVTTAAGATSAFKTGLKPGGSYYVRVRSFNVDAYGSWTTLPEPVLIPAGGKVWNGTAWVPALAKVWTGTEWKVSRAKVWDGTQWKTAK